MKRKFQVTLRIEFHSLLDMRSYIDNRIDPFHLKKNMWCSDLYRLDFHDEIVTPPYFVIKEIISYYEEKFKVRLRLDFTNYYPKNRITEDLMKFTRYANCQCSESYNGDTFRMVRYGNNDNYYSLYFVQDFMTSLHFWIKEIIYCEEKKI